MSFIIVVGGGQVGKNVTRTLLELGHEVVVLEQRRDRYLLLDEEFGHRARYGDATELSVLESAGIRRPADIVVAVTGDDEDNIVIGQLAKELYGIAKVVARVNDPRNQAHFDLLGVAPTVSATEMVMALVQHEMPQHELVHLVKLARENLEIVEVEVGWDSPAAGKRVEQLRLPETARLISVMREGDAEIAVGSTELRPGDQVLAILEPGGSPSCGSCSSARRSRSASGRAAGLQASRLGGVPEQPDVGDRPDASGHGRDRLRLLGHALEVEVADEAHLAGLLVVHRVDADVDGDHALLHHRAVTKPGRRPRRRGCPPGACAPPAGRPAR